MRIKIPNLPGCSCPYFIACGNIADGDKETLEWLKRHGGPHVAKTKVKGKPAFVHARFNGAFASHCHIDVTLKEFFGDEDAPKPTRTLPEIESIFEPLTGKRIFVEAEAVFETSVDKLPPIIKTTMLLDAIEDQVSIRMTGGQLSVSGLPVYAISWRLFREEKADDEMAGIRLEARLEEKIDEEYLIRMFDVLKTAFDSFIEVGVPHVLEKSESPS